MNDDYNYDTGALLAAIEILTGRICDLETEMQTVRSILSGVGDRIDQQADTTSLHSERINNLSNCISKQLKHEHKYVPPTKTLEEKVKIAHIMEKAGIKK